MTEQSINPRNTVCYVGLNTDFSGWTVSPNESMSMTVSLMFCLHE